MKWWGWVALGNLLVAEIVEATKRTITSLEHRHLITPQDYPWCPRITTSMSPNYALYLLTWMLWWSAW